MGDETWAQIVDGTAPPDTSITTGFESEQRIYRVVHSTAPNGEINVYMTPA